MKIDLRSVLALPLVFKWFHRAVGDDRLRRIYVNDFVRPKPGDIVLDVGCGPADTICYLPHVHYHGIDLSERYIAAAQARYGARGTFEVRDVADMVAAHPSRFDKVIAMGVLHHLPDAAIHHLFAVLTLLLKPNGRFISIDGCYVKGQSRVARYLLSHDRGQFVRTETEYLNLTREIFPTVTATVRSDLYRIPYTHLIMDCVAPLGGEN